MVLLVSAVPQTGLAPLRLSNEHKALLDKWKLFGFSLVDTETRVISESLLEIITIDLAIRQAQPHAFHFLRKLCHGRLVFSQRRECSLNL